ncbi:MAG: hypothetical protein JWN46_2221 [Acidimicrobiales bacterium]|nr:hypothetical protein [Acidimicrobiales bacterium]
MARQLSLIGETSTWRLDERTREIGRRGIASARAALAAAARHEPDHDRAGRTAA